MIKDSCVHKLRQAESLVGKNITSFLAKLQEIDDLNCSDDNVLEINMMVSQLVIEVSNSQQT